MRYLILAVLAAIVAGCASAPPAAAGNCPPPPCPSVVVCPAISPPCPPRVVKRHRRPHHVRHHAPPAVVAEAPVVHETHLIEKVIVDYVVVERPTRVVVPCNPCVTPRLPCNPCAWRRGGQLGDPPVGAPTPGSYRGPMTDEGFRQAGWNPTVDCRAKGGTYTINPRTGNPSCFVPNR